jgi:hypothetical protein
MSSSTNSMATIFTKALKRNIEEVDDPSINATKVMKTNGDLLLDKQLNDICSLLELNKDIDISEDIIDECYQTLFCTSPIETEILPKSDPFITQLNKIINTETEIETGENKTEENKTEENKKISDIACELMAIPMPKNNLVTKHLNNCDSNELPFKIKILSLFRAMVFRTFNPVVCNYDVDDGFILYEDIFKVKVYITKCEVADDIIDYFTAMSAIKYNLTTEFNLHMQTMNILDQSKQTSKQFIIHFGFPFFIFIKIDSKGTCEWYRKNFMETLETSKNIDTILYSSTNTSYNNLDIVIANNLILHLLQGNFKKGIDFMSVLVHNIHSFRINSHKIFLNKRRIYFKNFYDIYNTIRTNIATIPVQY